MIGSILSYFNDVGVKYVSWKNNHEIDLALRGDSDLDIFIPLQWKGQVFEIAKKENWIPAVNPVADYPDVYHFYTIDEDLICYHLHIYFKIITGESWIKEYDFPMGDFLIQNRTRHPSGIYVLNDKAQSFLFVLRHFIKGGSIFSRLLYKQEIDSYQEEWNLCKQEFDPKAYTTMIDFTNYLDKSGLNNQFTLPERKTAEKVRSYLRKYLRLPKSDLSWLRLRSFKKRVFNKIFYRRTKILPANGFILAFSGADGVGKSTMTKTIRNSYQSFLTVKKVQLGKPQGKWIEAIRELLSKQPNKNTFKNRNKAKKNGQKVSLKKALSAVCLAYLRYKRSLTARKYSAKNYLVISDRWATVENGKMDGPKLSFGTQGGLYKMLAKVEKHYYNKLTTSDLCIILTVPLETAIERNRRRLKKDKETDEEIKMRYVQNINYSPKSNNIVSFDNNGNLDAKRFELIKLIQSELFQGL